MEKTENNVLYLGTISPHQVIDSVMFTCNCTCTCIVENDGEKHEGFQC